MTPDFMSYFYSNPHLRHHPVFETFLTPTTLSSPVQKIRVEMRGKSWIYSIMYGTITLTTLFISLYSLSPPEMLAYLFYNFLPLLYISAVSK